MLYLRGCWSESEAALKRSIELARSFDGTFPAILGAQRLALLETALGRYDEAHHRIREVLPAARASSNSMVRGHTPGRLLATAIRNRFEAGDLDAATDYVAQGFAQQAASGECPTCDVMLYPAAVPVYLALGDLAQAEHATSKAEETARLFCSGAWTAAARACHGLLAAARQEWEAAAMSFEAALRTFEALDQPYDVARTLDALADVAEASPFPVGQDAGLLRMRAAKLYARLGAPRAPWLVVGRVEEVARKGQGSAPA